jgi:TolB-like protein/tetratricopeptide (TPR) repeat protein
VADVFISYVREDLHVAQKIAHGLDSAGISVWWDRHIRGGAEFGTEIEAQLTTAKAVIVIWSARSVESAWVRDEASYARDQKRLVPLRVDASQPPLGFRQMQTLDFNGWKGNVASEPFADLMSALEHLRGSATTTSSASTFTKAPRRRTALFVGAAILSALFVLGAWIFGDRLVGFSSELPPIRSLAVLPLENLSGDPEQGYFADAMTETLIAELANLAAIRVISRTSVMQYKGKHRPLGEIAGELHVDGIIEGSVLRSGDQVRITTQLIDARNDRHLWAEHYDRELTHVLDIQSEVARKVAGIVEIKLSHEQVARLRPKKPVDPRAQDAYFRGLAHRSRWDRESENRSIAAFEDGIAISPNYAEAYASLAGSLVMRAYTGTLSDADPRANQVESFAKAKLAAMHAVALDDSLGDAHMALGVALFHADGWDLAGAERELRRGRELGANDPVTCSEAPSFFNLIGRPDEARTWMEEAIVASPFDPYARMNYMFYFLGLGELDRAIEEVTRVCVIDPSYSGCQINRVLVLQEAGRFEEAIQQDRRNMSFAPEYFTIGGGTFDVDALERAWRSDGAQGYWRYLAQAVLADGPTYNPVGAATVYARIGELDQALAALEQAHRKPAIFPVTTPLTQALLFDEFKSLRGDARFIDLARGVAATAMNEHDLVGAAKAYTAINMVDEAFAALEQACRMKLADALDTLDANGSFAPLSGDPRFDALTCRKALRELVAETKGNTPARDP